ncbi:flagellar biosynthetic protein FliR [Ligilactobacillus sp. WILCCON 0076]|uniref:Flagellar biosynthetic protein FliR n=1 Tax=Ligilactobacillus ubinensis TaxID=2876789 RepID=A0A9X2FIX2_9LACO|nr:flagellar biosynthetic protein FliR [Ligilactobacillus ubinensis]MCP0886239.1 flagellar biosynthetic protein FliR [Ligilactobacillus ubinensis]
MDFIQLTGLIICRIATFVILAPLFSEKNFPNLAKLIVVGSLTIVAFPMVSSSYHSVSGTIYILLAIKETLFGMLMGYVSKLAFDAITMSGAFIDFQTGLTMAQAYDPTFQTENSTYGKIYNWMAIMVFFALNLHQLMIRGLMYSFQIVPIGSANVITGPIVGGVVKLFAKAFAMSVSLAAPLVVAVLVVDIVLGIIARTIPQINVLMLGMSIKTIVALIIFLLALPNVIDFLEQILPHAYTYMVNLINYLHK